MLLRVLVRFRAPTTCCPDRRRRTTTTSDGHHDWRALPVLARPAATPGSSWASRTPAPTMLTMPTTRNSIRPNSIAPNALLHSGRARSQRRHRDGQLACALRSIRPHAHLPRAERHHPQAAGIELRIVLGALRDVRRGREFGSRPAQRQRNHAHFANIVAMCCEPRLQRLPESLRAGGSSPAAGTARRCPRRIRPGCRRARTRSPKQMTKIALAGAIETSSSRTLTAGSAASSFPSPCPAGSSPSPSPPRDAICHPEVGQRSFPLAKNRWRT